MFSRYYYYLCNVRVNNFRVQNRVRVILSLFFLSMQIAWQKHCYYSKTPLLLHYKSNGVYMNFVLIVELVGFEPTSKQGNTVLSTRLFRPSFVRL